MSHKRIEHGLKMFHYPAVLPAEAIIAAGFLKAVILLGEIRLFVKFQ